MVQRIKKEDNQYIIYDSETNNNLAVIDDIDASKALWQSELAKRRIALAEKRADVNYDNEFKGIENDEYHIALYEQLLSDYLNLN